MQNRSKPDAVAVDARTFRKRIGAILVLDRGMRGFTGGAVFAGVLVLVLRIVSDQPSVVRLVQMSAAILAAATAVATLTVWRRIPSLDACVAALDAASQAGGLFMAAKATGAGAWPVPARQMPTVRQTAARRARTGAALSAAFVVLALSLPEAAFPRMDKATRLSIDTLVGKEMERAAQLEAADLLPEETAAALTNELARLSETGDATDPARVLEALDHIAEDLGRVAEEEAMGIVEERTAIQATHALAESLSEALSTGTLSPEDLSRLAEAMDTLLASMPASEALRSELQALSDAHAGALSPEMLKALSERLRNADALAAGKLAKLADLRLVDPERLRKCRGGECRGGSCTNATACAAALEDMLSGNDECAEAAAMLAACARPGTGGISRGRGDAPLTWTDPASRGNAGFRDEALSPNRLPDASQSQLQGLSASAPEVSDTAATVTPGALADGGTATGTITPAALLPRHREAVRRYFNEGN